MLYAACGMMYAVYSSVLCVMFVQSVAKVRDTLCEKEKLNLGINQQVLPVYGRFKPVANPAFSCISTETCSNPG
jgi:hypothetical protein